MSWTYEQLTGKFTDPSGTLQGKGYSGQPPYTNKPDSEGLEGLGPIPVGMWEATSVIAEHPKLGPFVIVLRPDEVTREKVIALGREPDSFRVHGERMKPPPGYASDGCIIQIRTVRELYWNSLDKWIQVVAQAPLVGVEGGIAA